MPTLTRSELTRCMATGAAAGRAGEPVTACPHSPASTDVNERLRAAAWVRAWVLATRDARRLSVVSNR